MVGNTQPAPGLVWAVEFPDNPNAQAVNPSSNSAMCSVATWNNETGIYECLLAKQTAPWPNGKLLVPTNTWLQIGFASPPPLPPVDGSAVAAAPAESAFFASRYDFAAPNNYRVRVQASATDILDFASQASWTSFGTRVAPATLFSSLGWLNAPPGGGLTFDGSSSPPPAQFSLTANGALGPLTWPFTLRFKLFRPFALDTQSADLFTLVVPTTLSQPFPRAWALRVYALAGSAGGGIGAISSLVNITGPNAASPFTAAPPLQIFAQIEQPVLDSNNDASPTGISTAPPSSACRWSDVVLRVASVNVMALSVDNVHAVAPFPAPTTVDLPQLAAVPPTVASVGYTGGNGVGSKTPLLSIQSIHYFPRLLQTSEVDLLSASALTSDIAFVSPTSFNAVSFFIGNVPPFLSNATATSANTFPLTITLTPSVFLRGNFTLQLSAGRSCKLSTSALLFGFDDAPQSFRIESLGDEGEVIISFSRGSSPASAYEDLYALPADIRIPVVRVSGAPQAPPTALLASALLHLVSRVDVAPSFRYTVVPSTGAWSFSPAVAAQTGATQGLDLRNTVDLATGQNPLVPATAFNWPVGFSVNMFVLVNSVPPPVSTFGAALSTEQMNACLFDFADPSFSILGLEDYSASASRMRLEMVAPSSVRFRVYRNGYFTSELTPLPLGRWVSLALTLSGASTSVYPLGNTASLFVDGVRVWSRPLGVDLAADFAATNSRFTLLRAASCKENPSDLLLSSFTFFPRALSAAEAMTLALAPVRPSNGTVPVIANPQASFQAHQTSVIAGSVMRLKVQLGDLDPRTLATDLLMVWSSPSHPTLLPADPPLTGPTLDIPAGMLNFTGTYEFVVVITDVATGHQSAAGVAPNVRLNTTLMVTPAPQFVVSATTPDPCLLNNPCSVGGRCVSNLVGSKTDGVYELSCVCATTPYLFFGKLCSFALLACPSCTSRYSGGSSLTMYGLGLDAITDMAIVGQETDFGAARWRDASSESGAGAAEVAGVLASLAKFDASLTRVQSVTFRTPNLVGNATTNTTGVLSNPISAYQPLQLRAALPGSTELASLNFSSLLFFTSSTCLSVGVFKPDGRGDCLPCPTGGFCPGGGRVWPLSGYWSWSEYTEPVACKVPEACPGVDPSVGETGTDRVTMNTQVCAEAYTGPSCARFYWDLLLALFWV
jgi:hypothetical protein